jgi:hypothetical protein
VPTIPASAIAAMPRRMLPTPLELLSFARIAGLSLGGHRGACFVATDYRRRRFIIDEIRWRKPFVNIRIERKKWRRQSAAEGMGRSPRERWERAETRRPHAGKYAARHRRQH